MANNGTQSRSHTVSSELILKGDELPTTLNRQTQYGYYVYLKSQY